MPCTNCGAENVEVFCAHCGEKQPGHHDLAVNHFAHDVVHEVVHLDGKLFRTLRDLVTKPGLLTVEYFAGRKKRYITPLRLFITLFALQFLAFTAYKPAAIFSIEKMAQYEGAGKLREMIGKKAVKHQMNAEQLAERIDARWQRNLSLLQFVNILGVALVLKLIYLRRKRFLVEHLVFAAHYYSFVYVVLLLTWPIYATIGFVPGPRQQVMSAIHILIDIVYLYFALRRFYGQGKGKTMLKTALAWGGSYVVQVTIIGGALIAALWHYR